MDKYRREMEAAQAEYRKKGMEVFRNLMALDFQSGKYRGSAQTEGILTLGDMTVALLRDVGVRVSTSSTDTEKKPVMFIEKGESTFALVEDGRMFSHGPKQWGVDILNNLDVGKTDPKTYYQILDRLNRAIEELRDSQKAEVERTRAVVRENLKEFLDE